MPFLSQNYIKKPLAVLLLLALLLPFLPAKKPVQAQAGILDWLQTKLAAIHIPQMGITKEGHLNIGSWCLIGRGCLLNTCFKSENPSLSNSPCVNPFDDLTLKWGGEEVSSQMPLVNEQGLPAIPQIEFLPQCELRIPPPESEETLTTEQKLAQRTACLYLTRLQKAASQEIYLAKKIFNNTDPFSECLFLRNCRSDCSLALGEFTFTVTILDIAALFLPGGAMVVVQKVMNIAKIINQIRTTWQIVRTLLNDSVNFVNDFLKAVQYVTTFLSSFSELGLKFSDALIYGGGAFASWYLGSKLPGADFDYESKIGVGQGGAIGWLKRRAGDTSEALVSAAEWATGVPGWTLQAGNGLLGGLAATAVFNQDRAQKGFGGLKEMLSNFASNLLKFSTAKSEALTFNDQLIADVSLVRNDFKQEREINFLFSGDCLGDGFTPNLIGNACERREYIDEALENLYTVFESIDSFVGEVLQGGTLKNGQLADQWLIGFDELDDSGFIKVNLACKTYQGFDDWPAYEPGTNKTKGYFRIYCDSDWGQLQKDYPKTDDVFTAADLKIDVSFEKQNGTYLCQFTSPRTVPYTQCPTVLANPHLLPAALFQKIQDGDCHWFGNLLEILRQVMVLQPFLAGIQDKFEKLAEFITKAGPNTAFPWLRLTKDNIEEELADALSRTGQCLPLHDPDVCSPEFGDQIDACNFCKGLVVKIALLNEIIEAREDMGAIWKDIYKLIAQRAGLLLESWPSANDPLWTDSQYWQKVTWAYHPSLITPDSWCGSLDQIVSKLRNVGHFNNSYDAEIAFETWDDKISIIYKAGLRFNDLREALFWGLQPKDPLFAYQAEKINRKLNDALSRLGEIPGTGAGGGAEPIEPPESCFQGADLTDCLDLCNDWGEVCDEKEGDCYDECQARQVFMLFFDVVSRYTDALSDSACRASCNEFDCPFCDPAKEICQEYCDINCALSCEESGMSIDCCLLDICDHACRTMGEQECEDECRVQCRTTCPEEHDLFCPDGVTTLSQCRSACLEQTGDCKQARNDCWDYCASRSIEGVLTNGEDEAAMIVEGNACNNACDEFDCPDCDEGEDDCRASCSSNLSSCLKPLGGIFIKYSCHLSEDCLVACRRGDFGCQDQCEDRCEDECDIPPIGPSCLLPDDIKQIFIDNIQLIQEKLDEIADLLRQLQKIWNEMPRGTTESQLARDYLQKIIEAIRITRQIIEEILPQIITAKTNLEDILDELAQCPDLLAVVEAALQALQTDIIDFLREKIGESYTCQPTATGFLHKVKCFEEDNRRAFEDLLDFTDVVYALEKTTLSFDYAKQALAGLEPQMRLEPLQIRDDLVGQIEQKAQDCLKCEQGEEAFCDKCQKKPQVYTGQRTGESSYQTFKEKLLSNPLTTIEDKFGSIYQDVHCIATSIPDLSDEKSFLKVCQEMTRPFLGFGLTALAKNSVLGLAGEAPRYNKYKSAFEGLDKATSYYWWELIWGTNLDLREACQDVSLVLNNDPEDIEQTCQGRTSDDVDLLENAQLAQTCRDLMEVDPEVLEDPAAFQTEMDELTASRNCIRRVRCGGDNSQCPPSQQGTDGSGPYCCIACPTWDCQGSDDPLCDEVDAAPDDVKEIDGVNLRLQCSALWDTSYFTTNASKVWPPCNPCAGKYWSWYQVNSCACSGDYADGSTAITLACRENQQAAQSMQKAQTIIENAGGPSALPGLLQQCNRLAYQQALADECNQFYDLRRAFKGDCGELSGAREDKCDEVRERLKQFCDESIKKEEFDCSFFERPRADFTFNDLSPFSGSAQSRLEALADARRSRVHAKMICSESFSDVRTPLTEVMKVFSILLGIRSFTGAKASLGSLYTDAKKLWERLEEVIDLIKSTPAKFKELWDSQDKITKIGWNNFKINPVQCIENPMQSYSPQTNKIRTGPQGGPVCPDVADFFAQLDAQFSLLRQNLRMIDLVRRDAINEIKLGHLGITIGDYYEINDELNKVVAPIYQRAEQIKDDAQMLWALATAVDFANQNCTCGKSWCPTISFGGKGQDKAGDACCSDSQCGGGVCQGASQNCQDMVDVMNDPKYGPDGRCKPSGGFSIPLCISGLPLTLAPLNEPYCALVWLLRYPMGSLAAKIEAQLEQERE